MQGGDLHTRSQGGLRGSIEPLTKVASLIVELTFFRCAISPPMFINSLVPIRTMIDTTKLAGVGPLKTLWLVNLFDIPICTLAKPASVELLRTLWPVNIPYISIP